MGQRSIRQLDVQCVTLQAAENRDGRRNQSEDLETTRRAQDHDNCHPEARFAFWDIFYYVGLWLMIRWSPSLLTEDVLFPIPTP
jgi:hypothetical protein